jgi:hypothetical protein
MPVISVRVNKRVYSALNKLAQESGISLYEYVKRLLEDHVNVRVSAQVSGEVSAQVSSHEVERKLSELTLRLDSALKAIQALQESDRVLAEKLSALESMVSVLKTSATTNVTTTNAGASSSTQIDTKKRKTAIEVLREAKVRCISEMKGARNPEAIIEKMRREGAVVVRTDEDVCAVDPDYWGLFKKKVNESKTPDDKEILSRLKDEKMKRLFQLLRKAGALYLDAKSKEWIYDYSFIEEPGEKRREEEEVSVDWEYT